jgi:hypothetical protein
MTCTAGVMVMLYVSLRFACLVLMLHVLLLVAACRCREMQREARAPAGSSQLLSAPWTPEGAAAARVEALADAAKQAKAAKKRKRSNWCVMS